MTEIPSSQPVSIEQKIVDAMKQPHPINSVLDTTNKVEEIHDQVSTFLQKPKMQGEPEFARRLGMETWVSIWTHIMAQEYQNPLAQLPNPIQDDPKNPTDFQLKTRRNQIAVAIIDAYARQQIPALPDIRVGYTKSPKEWAKPEFWNNHPELAKELASFITSISENTQQIKEFILGPGDEANFEDLSTRIGPQPLEKGLSPLDVSTALLDNLNTVSGALSLRLEFAMRFLKFS